jgi:hypothetical protein
LSLQVAGGILGSLIFPNHLKRGIGGYMVKIWAVKIIVIATALAAFVPRATEITELGAIIRMQLPSAPFPHPDRQAERDSSLFKQFAGSGAKGLLVLAETARARSA